MDRATLALRAHEATQHMCVVRLSERSSLADLTEWLCAVDPNGSYRDADTEMDTDAAWECVADVLQNA